MSGSLTTGGANFGVLEGATLDLVNGTVTTSEVNIEATASLTERGSINGALAISGDVVNEGVMRLHGGAALSASGHFINNGVLDLLGGAQGLPADFENNGVVIDSSSLRSVNITKNGSVVTITMESYPGHTYQLQRSGSLTASS